MCKSPHPLSLCAPTNYSNPKKWLKRNENGQRCITFAFVRQWKGTRGSVDFDKQSKRNFLTGRILSNSALLQTLHWWNPFNVLNNWQEWMNKNSYSLIFPFLLFVVKLFLLRCLCFHSLCLWLFVLFLCLCLFCFFFLCSIMFCDLSFCVIYCSVVLVNPISKVVISMIANR